MGQGERLKDIIISLLESPKSFADGIGLSSPTTIYDVINGRREITPALLKRIIETYPNLNPDWLLKGTLPKLLTSKSEVKEELNEESGVKIYGSKCPFCYEKDKRIEKLISELSELRKEYIECLKQISGLRNASSG